jgi:hypothetical protein
VAEYDKLAKRGQKALNGRSTGQGKSAALNGRPSQQRSSKS